MLHPPHHEHPVSFPPEASPYRTDASSPQAHESACPSTTSITTKPYSRSLGHSTRTAGFTPPTKSPSRPSSWSHSHAAADRASASGMSYHIGWTTSHEVVEWIFVSVTANFDLRSSLAYMEMYMAIAYLIRRFDFALAGTTEKDMEWDDMVVPQFHGQFQVFAKRRAT